MCIALATCSRRDSRGFGQDAAPHFHSSPLRGTGAMAGLSARKTMEVNYLTTLFGNRVCAAPETQQHLHGRSEEHTSELQSLMRIAYAVVCMTKKSNNNVKRRTIQQSNHIQ